VARPKTSPSTRPDGGATPPPAPARRAPPRRPQGTRTVAPATTIAAWARDVAANASPSAVASPSRTRQGALRLHPRPQRQRPVRAHLPGPARGHRAGPAAHPPAGGRAATLHGRVVRRASSGADRGIAITLAAASSPGQAAVAAFVLDRIEEKTRDRLRSTPSNPGSCSSSARSCASAATSIRRSSCSAAASPRARVATRPRPTRRVGLRPRRGATRRAALSRGAALHPGGHQRPGRPRRPARHLRGSPRGLCAYP